MFCDAQKNGAAVSNAVSLTVGKGSVFVIRSELSHYKWKNWEGFL